MKITTTQTLKILYVLAWIIFVGVCIEAGGFIFNAFFTLVLNPVGARHFWKEVDLDSLYYYDHGHFFAITFMMCIVAIMKGYLFYLIVKILHGNKVNMSKPFSAEVGRFTFKLSYLSLVIGVFSWQAANYVGWLVKQGVNMPDIQYLRVGGGDVWLFMSVTLFVIAQIFKKGIEIQSENELTV